ncbi:MAG: acyl-CoA dehydrogenase, partial [Myxococcales bacterium]|nr:acyl-CoA dehydrogenase [Myxococcales bacterium]
TRELASAVDRILRKHGKDIIGKQFASNRLAEIMIDLFVWACVMARVNSAIEAKAKDVEAQLRIVEVFAGRAGSRIRANFRKIDDNDDEHIKALSDHAFELGKFGWDTL